MKRNISIILVVILLISTLFGCGGNSGTSSDEKRKIAYYAYNTEPYLNLDPSIEYSNGVVVMQNIYETLTKYDANQEKVVPLLAESWEKNEDGTVWKFKLRENAKFHDGTVVNADAVVKSIKRTIDLNLGAAFIWDSVEKIDSDGKFQVTFTLKYPAPIDLIASAGYAAYIISPDACDKDADWFNEGNDGGSGPYKIMKIVKGEEVTFEKFDDY